MKNQLREQKTVSFTIQRADKSFQTNEVVQMLTIIMDKLEKIEEEVEALKEVTMLNQVILEELIEERARLKPPTSLSISRNRFRNNNSESNLRKLRRSLVN